MRLLELVLAFVVWQIPLFVGYRIFNDDPFFGSVFILIAGVMLIASAFWIVSIIMEEKDD